MVTVTARPLPTKIHWVAIKHFPAVTGLSQQWDYSCTPDSLRVSSSILVSDLQPYQPSLMEPSDSLSPSFLWAWNCRGQFCYSTFSKSNCVPASGVLLSLALLNSEQTITTKNSTRHLMTKACGENVPWNSTESMCMLSLSGLHAILVDISKKFGLASFFQNLYLFLKKNCYFNHYQPSSICS